MKIIKIGAKWCSGCLVMKPRWKEIETEYPWLRTEYYDFDDDADKIKKYNVATEVLPCFIFMDTAGNEITRLHGEVPKEGLIDTILAYRDR